MLNSIAENFARQGRPEKWRPLEPSYERWKHARGKTKILILHGIMRNSVSFKAMPGKLILSSRTEYSRYQQVTLGRPFLLFQEEDVDLIKEIIMNYLLQK